MIDRDGNISTVSGENVDQKYSKLQEAKARVNTLDRKCETIKQRFHTLLAVSLAFDACFVAKLLLLDELDFLDLGIGAGALSLATIALARHGKASEELSRARVGKEYARKYYAEAKLKANDTASQDAITKDDELSR